MTNRRRDRRGRGLRGPLAPPGVPLSLTRAALFDELVLDAVEHLDQRWSDSLRAVEFAVEDVPPAPSPDSAGVEAEHVVPLGRSAPALGDRPARVVVYRRPVEGRAGGPRARAALVHDVVVELVAELLGLEPDTVDPGYPEHDGWG
jgi:predicted Zn-dependent protease with MMP-like domain